MAKKTVPDFLKINEGSIDVTLSRPMEVSGAKTSVLRMREPTVGDQLAAMKGEDPAHQEMTFFTNLCMLAPAELEKMPLRDYQRLQAAFGFFTD